MVEKKQPPSETTNNITYDCDIKIFEFRRTILKISPHCWKRNEEFQASKKKKIKENLDQYLLDKKVIKDFVQQLRDEDIWFESINSDWPAWKYYGCQAVIDKRNGLNYRIIFLLDDNNPEILGVITVYPYE